MSGSSAFGFPANLEIAPLRAPGIWWQIPNGRKILLGNASVGVHKLFHYTILKWEQEVLRVPEHLLGLLFAAGIDSVCLVPRESRLPYDGSAKTFWGGIRPALCADGKLNLYTPAKTVSVEMEPGKYVRFFSNPTARTLEYEIAVNYRAVGSYVLKGEIRKTDLDNLCSARPYGRSWAHKMLSRFTHRDGQYVWFEPVDNQAEKESKLREIATHRLLDLLGALAYVRPPGGTLVGKIETRPFVGHISDILLLSELRKTGLIKIS